MKALTLTVVLLLITQNVFCNEYFKVNSKIPIKKCFGSKEAFIECAKRFAEEFAEEKAIEYAGEPALDKLQNGIEALNDYSHSVCGFTKFILDNFGDIKKELFVDFDSFLREYIF